jgi:hypothetical protein
MAIDVDRFHANHDVALFVVLSLLGEAKNNMNMVRNVLAFLALSCIGLSAQQITGNIRGTVTDPSGAVIRGAAVTAQQAETGLSRTTTTDRDGNYVLLELPVGHYRLQVGATGFQEHVQNGITLNVNETPRSRLISRSDRKSSRWW